MRPIAARDDRRSGQAGRGGAHTAKYTGIVKDNRDDEKLGHLQVSVPSLFPADELVTARPALPYGFFFVPENEAKVWVEFEGGDPGLPIWTGIQYVAGEWATEAEANPPQRRVIKTASGHLMQFFDKSGEEMIEIKDGVNGHVITLDKNGILITDGKNQHQLVLDGSGVKIKDGKNSNTITLAAAGVTIENSGGAKVELVGPMVKLAGGSMPVIRTIDNGIGNLGAPVPLISGPGNLMVLA